MTRVAAPLARAAVPVEVGDHHTASRLPVLYLTRNGLLEPLGQSQVMAYLRGLARDHAITLVTREKPEDWADAEAVALARADCAAAGIRWLPAPFRRRPRLVAPALDLIAMARQARAEVRAGRAQLIHARSYLPAAVAWAVWRLTGTPFVFDMRALWPEELITAGRLRRGSALHAALRAMERRCLRDAAAVVSLTEAAAEHLREAHAADLAGRRIAVIPTCVDLARFAPRAGRAPGPRVHGCIGTVLSGWFLTDWLAAWFEAAAARDPQARFEVVTRCDPARVRQALDGAGRLGARLTIGARPPGEMAQAIRGHDLSVMFYAGGQLSELGRSPTRMGEALASGLPVIANAGVGDVARIIAAHRVGVLVEGPSPDHMAAGLAAYEALARDPGLPARCRAAAEAVFSLAAGTEAYRALYRDILTGAGADGRSLAAI